MVGRIKLEREGRFFARLESILRAHYPPQVPDTLLLLYFHYPHLTRQQGNVRPLFRRTSEDRLGDRSCLSINIYLSRNHVGSVAW